MSRWVAALIAVVVVIAAGWVLTRILGLAWFLAAGAIRGLAGIVALLIIGVVIYSLFAGRRQKV